MFVVIDSGEVNRNGNMEKEVIGFDTETKCTTVFAIGSEQKLEELVFTGMKFPDTSILRKYIGDEKVKLSEIEDTLYRNTEKDIETLKSLFIEFANSGFVNNMQSISIDKKYSDIIKIGGDLFRFEMNYGNNEFGYKVPLFDENDRMYVSNNYINMTDGFTIPFVSDPTMRKYAFNIIMEYNCMKEVAKNENI